MSYSHRCFIYTDHLGYQVSVLVVWLVRAKVTNDTLFFIRLDGNLSGQVCIIVIGG